MCETVFSGVSSFCTITEAYDALGGARPSQLSSSGWSMESLTLEILARFGLFLNESAFLDRCRLILDLFKLQIMLAGLVYE